MKRFPHIQPGSIRRESRGEIETDVKDQGKGREGIVKTAGVLERLRNENISSDLSVEIGELCFRLGIFDSARDFFDKALSLDPNNTDALNNLGVLSYSLSDHRAAEDFLLKAIELSPANKKVRENLALLYEKYRHKSREKNVPFFVCPCCKGNFPKFIPGGVNLRPNAQCPGCGSLERHRLLWLYLKNRTNLFSATLKVLHFAPELFFQRTLEKIPSLDYVSADLSSHQAMIKMSITDISYGDNTFDVILCIHVLEHVMDDQKAMKELLRVLKPGGWAILQSPIDLHRDQTLEAPNMITAKDRERMFGQKDHVRTYGRDYRRRLEKAGFIVKPDSYVKGLGAALTKKYGLIAEEDIYFCVKPLPGN